METAVMARDGSGGYSLPHPTFTPGTLADADQVAANNADLTTAMAASIAKDGQTTPTANLPMGTYKHTGVGNASARTDYAATGQVQDGSFTWCGTAGGSKNALTLSPSPAITAYATGQKFRFKAGSTASDDAVTIAVSGQTAKAGEIDDAALSATVVIEANKYYEALYDGTAFQLTRLSQGAATPTETNVRPNILINGHMLAAQRGVSFTGGTANADDTYTLDRWYNLAEGNDSVDITQASDSPDDNGFSYAMDVETTGEKFGLAQIIEADNCIGAIGNTVTLSFSAKVSNARIDTVKAAIISWSGTADSVTSDFISSWNADGTTPTLIANATFENTPADLGVTTSWATYSVSASVDTASAKNIIVFIWSDDATNPNASDFLYVTNVKLEVGSAATDFTPDEKTVNLAKCQRYYFRYTADGSNDYLNCLQAYSTSGAQGRLLNLPVTMRTNGTTQLSATGDITMSDSGFSFAAASNFVTGAKRNSIHVTSSARTGSGLTAGDSVSIVLSDTKWISVDAEL